MSNMGTSDRVRRVLAVVVIAAAYGLGYLNGPLAIVVGVVVLGFLVTSLLATCPAYMPFGISTLITADAARRSPYRRRSRWKT